MNPRAIFVWVSLWFASSFAIAQEKSITLEQALSIVQSYYEDNISGSEEYWLLTQRPAQWEIFVDEKPLANWAHECTIFKFPNTGDLTIDMTPEVIKPEPSFPPDEDMELLSGCAFYADVVAGQMSSLDTSNFEKIHQITILSGKLNETDFYFLNDCVNYEQLSQICLHNVVLENNTIPACAFVCYAVNGGFNKLQRIILPEGVETIGLAAFRGCNIRFMTFPSSVKTLEIDSCSDWKYIKWIYSEAVTPPTCDEYAFGGLTPEDTPIYVPVGSAEAYRNAPGWDYFTTFIETDEAPSAGIEAVTPSSEVKAYWADGAITIMSADDTFEYSIYSIDGRLVSQGIATGKEVRIPAPKSVYIVKSGRNVFKIF